MVKPLKTLFNSISGVNARQEQEYKISACAVRGLKLNWLCFGFLMASFNHTTTMVLENVSLFKRSCCFSFLTFWLTYSSRLQGIRNEPRENAWNCYICFKPENWRSHGSQSVWYVRVERGRRGNCQIYRDSTRRKNRLLGGKGKEFFKLITRNWKRF